MQEFNIENFLDKFMFKPEAFAEKYGFRITSAGKTKRVNSAPSTIDFAGGKFIGSFLYDADKLKRILLIPIIEDIEIPGYPCEEYQNRKQQYCIERLKSLYGENYSPVEGGVQWETDKYFIGSFAVTHGKDKFTDGDITITVK